MGTNPRTMIEINAECQRIAADPCASDWLRQSINKMYLRDPVDAANDAGKLAGLMGERATAVAVAALTVGDLTPA